MDAVLDGVAPEVAPIALDAGFLGPWAAEWLGAAAKDSPAARLAFHLDPLSAFARAGASPGPIAAHLAASARTAAALAPIYPEASLVLASGRSVHEAGGQPADEIAFALAAALAHVRGLEEAGVAREAAFSGVVLGLAADCDLLVTIAKLRAARLAYAKLAAACGAPSMIRIEARSSTRMLARVDAWTNLIRLALAGFAAAMGGADTIVLEPFTARLGRPTAMARRLAVNTQLILIEEAHVGEVTDPLAGSGAVERLTEDLARTAWRALRTIEEAGGLVEALRAGLIADRAAAGREALRAALADGSLRLVGVTDFRAEGAAVPETAIASPMPVAAPDPRRPGRDDACPPLTPVTLEALANWVA